MESMSTYTVYTPASGQGLVKAWTTGVPVESAAIDQLRNIAQLPFIHKWVAAMPDVHVGIGATVGSVIATKRAIIPAAVGVDIGCGMIAAPTNLVAEDLPDSLEGVRAAIEQRVPVGQPGKHDDRAGSWDNPPADVSQAWAALEGGWSQVGEHQGIARSLRQHPAHQLGTLGGGNHFIEVCLDETGQVWIMLHSGSRGVGNKIGQSYIDVARKDMQRWMISLPDKDLAYLPEGTEHFEEYWAAVKWAQDYAALNRRLMLAAVIDAVKTALGRDVTTTVDAVVSCHHNYVEREHHYGENVLVTRKGAVRARAGDLGIIPGSMGARSYIVRGKGNPESFESCSHGAGRAMSRAEAKRRFTLEDHIAATVGIECRKDAGVLDETPGAYKPIDAVLAAQTDLVDVVHELRQVVTVKG
jgi:tRNA-splicing ligase RtcB